MAEKLAGVKQALGSILSTKERKRGEGERNKKERGKPDGGGARL